jgi:hypothetical protein
MNNENNEIKQLDFSNLENFCKSEIEQGIDIKNLDKKIQNKILLESLIYAKELNDNSIVNYLITEKELNSKSLHYLNNKLNLKIKTTKCKI